MDGRLFFQGSAAAVSVGLSAPENVGSLARSDLIGMQIDQLPHLSVGIM